MNTGTNEAAFLPMLKVQRLLSYVSDISTPRATLKVSESHVDSQSPSPADQSAKIRTYTESSVKPTLLSEIHSILDAPINPEKLQSAIASAKPGKSPGPNRLTIQYYKLLSSQLLPYITAAFNALAQNSYIPRDSLNTYIT